MATVAQLRAALNAIPKNVQGMAWMVLAGLIFSVFMALVKWVGTSMHPIQVGFLRYAFGLAFLLPFFLQLRFAEIKAASWKFHGLRGVLHGVGVMLWFYAMSRIPLAEVTAIGFTNTVFATVGAALFLGEVIRLPRITAVLTGLLGALLIIRPGFEVIDPGAIAMLIGALLFAGSDLCAKVLTRNESGPAVVAYLSIVVTTVTLIPAIYVWQPPTVEEWVLIIVIAGLATLGHLAMTQSFKVGEMSAIQPAKFIQLLWSAVIGFALFAEVPDEFTWMGAAIIVASSLYIARREALARKRGRATVEPATRTGPPAA
jgi:drug/metabolite transporter (DMT)-like permease